MRRSICGHQHSSYLLCLDHSRRGEENIDSDSSHIAMPALDGLADHRGGHLIRDLDVPQFGFALRGEVGEQFWDDRDIADFVAAQAEAAGDGFERRPAEHSEAVVDAVGAQLVKLRAVPPSFIAQIRMR